MKKYAVTLRGHYEKTISVYADSPEEGTGQMKAFLAATPDARLVPLFAGNDGMLTLLPEESGEWRSDAQLPTVHDGFFYALLEKQA